MLMLHENATASDGRSKAEKNKRARPLRKEEECAMMTL
jgi:hypothetical protein